MSKSYKSDDLYKAKRHEEKFMNSSPGFHDHLSSEYVIKANICCLILLASCDTRKSLGLFVPRTLFGVHAGSVHSIVVLTVPRFATFI